MEISDFLLKYPYVDSTSKDTGVSLDTYTIPLQQAIYNKKEFYDFKLDSIETKPKNRGDLMRHQVIAQRYMSQHTPYDGVLLFHEVGTGKTCSAVAIAEQLKQSGYYTQCIVLVKGEPRIFNFMKELAFVCTDGKYIPANWEDLTSREKTIRLSKSVGTYYKFGTFATFAKRISDLSDANIKNAYENSVIIIDEVHNIRAKNKKEKDTYSQIHRFLHTLENKKIVLLTGTPMKDSPKELADIMNLILPSSSQMASGDKFAKDYLDQIGIEQKIPIYDVSDEGKMRMYYHLNGRISYLKAINDPSLKKVFMGKQNVGSLKHFKVFPSDMLEFQQESYTEAIDLDVSIESEDIEAQIEQEDAKSEETGVYKNSKQASLFVFPDGSWGSKGFSKYINESKSTLYKDKQSVTYTMKDDLDRALSRSIPVNERLSNLRHMSAKYASLVENLLANKDKNTFVYCGLVYGSGAILLSLILDRFDIKHGLVTGKTTEKQIDSIRATFNSPENVQGAKMQAIIGTPTFAEAYSLMNVQQVHILTPHWNYAETVQAIGRGVRAFSHAELKKVLGDANIYVDIYQHVSLPGNNKRSIDLYMYEIAEAKDVSIKNVENMIKITSYDCQLTRDRNLRDDPGSRECDYKASCDYYCMDITNTHPDPLDTSSYFDIYDENKQESIKRDIRKLFRIKTKYHLRDIVRAVNASTNEIVKALASIILSQEKLLNKNGFYLSLREFKNVYYLTDNIDIDSIPLESDYFNDVYTVKTTNMNELMIRYSDATLDNTIKKLERNVDNMDEFKGIIKNLPLNIQMMFVQYAFIAEKKDIPSNVALRRAILEVYKDYIKTVNGVDVLALDENNLMCMKKGKWVPCPPEMYDAYKESIKEQVKELVTNPYGYYGIFDSKKGAFKVRDVSSDELVENIDKRKKTSGRVCSTIHKNDQMAIIHSLKVDYTPSGKSKKELLSNSKLLSVSIENIADLSLEDLDRITFWLGKSSKDICAGIEKWFKDNNLYQVV